MQSYLFGSSSLYPFSLLDDGLRSAELGICGHDVYQALVVALVIAIFDERFDPRLESAYPNVTMHRMLRVPSIQGLGALSQSV